MTILITAFDPFGGGAVNISQELLEALPEELDGAVLHKLLLPTVFGKAAERAILEAERIRPDAIVCLGQAGGRTAITPERVGINCMDASLPDNAGQQPRDEAILPDAPAAYFATLPLRAMAEAIRAAGVPAQISNTAGTFVCNSLLYAMLHFTASAAPELPCGFLHLPCPDAAPGLSREALLRGLIAALRVLIH